MKAKGISLWAIVAGGLWVALHSLAMALWPRWNERSYGLSMRDVLLSGMFLILSWSPVYGSIWIDKFLERKLDDAVKHLRGGEDFSRESSRMRGEQIPRPPVFPPPGAGY